MARSQKITRSEVPLGRYFRRFTLKNVRTFRSPITLDFCESDGSVVQWTIILGENGTGKTTLLQYLAGMVPTDESTQSGEKNSWFASALAGLDVDWHVANFPRHQLNELRTEAVLEVSVPAENLHRAEADDDREPNLEFFIEFDRKKNLLELSERGAWHVRSFEYLNQLHLFGYGASRHVAGPSSPYLTSETFFKNGGSEPTSTLYHDDYPLISPEQWLLGLDHTSRGEGDIAKSAKRSYESARRCIVNTLPGIKGIGVKQHAGTKGQPAMALMCSTGYGEVRFSSLSLGYRTMAAWLIDFIKRMHEAYPDLDEPDDGPAVVLIDEFDLHMHPRWQREAMAALSKEFPNTQFIVTAHSPIVVQATEGHAKLIILRRRQREDGTEEVIADDNPRFTAGWRVDQILESVYGMKPRMENYSKLIERRVALRQKENLDAEEKRELGEIEGRLDNEAPAPPSEASEQLFADLQKALQVAEKVRLKR